MNTLSFKLHVSNANAVLESKRELEWASCDLKSRSISACTHSRTTCRQHSRLGSVLRQHGRGMLPEFGRADSSGRAFLVTTRARRRSRDAPQGGRFLVVETLTLDEAVILNGHNRAWGSSEVSETVATPFFEVGCRPHGMAAPNVPVLRCPSEIRGLLPRAWSIFSNSLRPSLVSIWL